MERPDHSRSSHGFRESVIHVHQLGAVARRMLENVSLLFDGSLKPASMLFPTARRDDGQRKTIPPGVDGFLRLAQVIETDLDTIRTG